MGADRLFNLLNNKSVIKFIKNFLKNFEGFKKLLISL